MFLKIVKSVNRAKLTLVFIKNIKYFSILTIFGIRITSFTALLVLDPEQRLGSDF